MKNRIIILESSKQQAFTSAQIMATKFRLEIESITPDSIYEVTTLAKVYEASEVYIRNDRGIMGLIHYLQKKGANRRNTEVLVICTENIGEPNARQLILEPIKQQLSQAIAA